MAPTLESNMQPSHKTLTADAPSLEIALRSRTKTARSSGTTNRSSHKDVHRSSLIRSEEEVGDEPRADNAHDTGIGEGSQHRVLGETRVGTRLHKAGVGRQPSGEKANGRPAGDGTGAGASRRLDRGGEGRAMGSKGNPPRTRASNGERRRVFINDYNDEEDEEKDSHQVSQPPPMKGKALTFHDSDINMQLVDISPEHGGSSLQLSMSNDDFTAAPNQAALLRLDTINLAEGTPTTTSYKSPRNATTSDNHSAKRRRGESGGLATIPDSHTSQHTKRKEPIPSIDIVAQMWLGFSIHEAIAIQKGTEIIHKHRTHEEFVTIGTPPKEVIDFKTLRRAFPRVPQLCYPNERPDAVLGNHLHFTQIPRLERVDPTTGLSEGFHVTIRFDFSFKSMSRQDVRGACLDRLRQMNISLGSTYSNPIDIGINAVTKNWAGFIKVHLQNPTQDGMALFRGHRAFVLEMEDGVKTIGKVEKGYKQVTKARNLRLHLKGETLRHELASTIF